MCTIAYVNEKQYLCIANAKNILSNPKLFCIMKKIFSLLVIAMFSLSTMMAHPGRLYLIGDATPNGWDLHTAALMLTVEDGVYEWVGDLSAGDLKFLENEDWIPSYGPATQGEALASGTMVKREQELQDNDNKYTVSAGRYSLRVDLTGENPQLTVADGTGMEDKGFSSHYPVAIYPIGDATAAGWSLDNAIELTETAFNSGIYQGQIALHNGELKFLHQRDWGKAYGATAANAPIADEGAFDIMITDDSNDNKFVVSLEKETTFTVTVNAVTNQLILAINDPFGIENTMMQNEIKGVYDLQGRMVSRLPVDLPAGLYILKGSQQTQKIIVK